MATATDFLSSYIGPIAEDLTPQQARKILNTKPSDQLIARIHLLAERANDGSLTDRERAEYEYYVDVDDVIGLLKARARSVLGDVAE
jgi:hypothetical protein